MSVRGAYDAFPEGFEEHDKLLVETQVILLKKIGSSTSATVAAKFAEAYALISGLAVKQPELKVD